MPTFVRVRCDELAQLAVINRRDIRPRNVSGPTIRVTYGGISRASQRPAFRMA